MDKKKQIDGIIEAMSESCGSCFGSDEAECIYNAGYRKASEVAREIFGELKSAGIDEWRYPAIAELKKKYESEDFIPAPPHTCQVEIPKYYESIINLVFPESEGKK